MSIIQEHSIKLDITLPKGDVSAKMDVFYNPVMVSNRNISVLLLNCIENMGMNIVDPLAGSGIRSLRFMKELKKGKMNHLFVNDRKENFKKTFKKGCTINKISLIMQKKMTIGTEEASLFLLNRINDAVKPEEFCGYADYIEIDPFGSPNPFLSAAGARIARQGIIAVTATDTAALSGTYPRVTVRKYWAKPLRNYLMHEIGLRILIRKIQLIGVQFDKALMPVLSYHQEHYMRVYVRSEKGKEKCDEVLRQHQYFFYCDKCLAFKTSVFNKEKCGCGEEYDFAGPLWVGKLFDSQLVEKMERENEFSEDAKFLQTLAAESKQEMAGFYDIHEIAHKMKIIIPKMAEILRKTKGVRTHFSPSGIKTQMSVKEVMKMLQG